MDLSQSINIKLSRHIEWESLDGKAFKEFLKEYYSKIMQVCEEIIKIDYRYEKYSLVLFERLAMPLVYLRDIWLLLPKELKEKYGLKLEALSCEKVRSLLDEVQKELVEIKEAGNVIIVKPIGYIGDLLWKSIHDRLAILNAQWIKAEDPSKSHWEIPKWAQAQK
jgi:hypothetical protein